MNYDNSKVRRQDRLLDIENALALLSNVEYGFLAFGNETGGYGIPINFVFSTESIYFHCAPEGEKLRYLDKNVCFCVVGTTTVQSSKFTTEYESVLVFGKIQVVEDDVERMKVLELLIDKYSAEHKEVGLEYAKKSFNRTKILRLNIERVSGKCKKMETRN